MAFKKVGDALQVKTVYCQCGGEINKKTCKCKKCKKNFSTSEPKPSENQD